MRNVLFVTNSFSYGGSEKHLLEIVRRLDDPTIRATILSTDADPFSERMSLQPYPEVRIRVEKSLQSIRDWVRVLQEIKPDTVILVYGTLWMLPWYVAAAVRLAGISRLYAIHHLMPQQPADPLIQAIRSPRDVLRRFMGRRVRKLLSAQIPPKLCRMTICVSDAVRNALIEDYGFPKRRTCTVHNGIHCQDFALRAGERETTRRSLGIREKDFLLVCTARLSREKGIGVLLSAMATLAPIHPACKCIVVGDGPLREELTAELKALKLESQVFFTGFQTDVRPYLAAADVFVLPSYIEGLPYSILEAMASGLPCVVTRVGGNREAVIDGLTGITVNSGSVDELVEAIAYLVTHSPERVQMAKAAQSRAWSDFEIKDKMTELCGLILA